MEALQAAVFFAEFLDKAASHQILKLFISPQTQHFFASAHRIALLQVLKNALKQIVETEYLVFREHIDKFIGHMIREAAGEPGSFRGGCHITDRLAVIRDKSDPKIVLYTKNKKLNKSKIVLRSQMGSRPDLAMDSGQLRDEGGWFGSAHGNFGGGESGDCPG